MRSNSITIAVLSAALFAAACHKRPTVVALPPPPPRPPAVSPAPSPTPAPAPAPVDQRDQALFHSALTYALAPAPDWQRAGTLLKQLIDEFPNSPLKAEANLILTLHSDLELATADNKQRETRIKQLTTELDRLKKIDADRRRKP